MESIAKKMTQVMHDCRNAPMTGRHHHNYGYHTREDAFIVRAKLVEYGIATTTRAEILDIAVNTVNVRVEVDFICTETGQVITASAVGQGQDKQDQAASKAQTNAIKNLFLNTFLLGKEEHGGYPATAPAPTPAIDTDDHKAACTELENVLTANAGIPPQDALIYMKKHVTTAYGFDSLEEVYPDKIRAFAEKMNNSLTNNHDAVIEKVTSTIQKLKEQQ